MSTYSPLASWALTSSRMTRPVVAMFGPANRTSPPKSSQAR